MMTYEHTQVGKVMLIVFGLVIVLMGAIVLFNTEPAAEPTLYIVLGIIIFSGLNFYKLNVTVRNGFIKATFGIGLIYRNIRIKKIQSAETVRNKWWYGYGIRLTPRGWMYNVSGFDAVELNFHSGRHFIIGTDDPKGLKAAIDEAIGKRSG